MKLTTFISSRHLLASLTMKSRSGTEPTANSQNNPQEINRFINFNSLRSQSPNANYLKTFDTAFIAYQMMGLNDYK